MNKVTWKREVVPALNEAKRKGIIRIIDYLFVMKDDEGNLTAAF